MAQYQQKLDAPRPQAAQAKARTDAGAFKPVALPALAACMQVNGAKPRQPLHRDVPAILREDALLG